MSDGKNGEILIVDDLPTVCRILKRQLSKVGYQTVHEANNVSGALKHLGESPPSLVIADLHIGEQDAEEIVRFIKDKELQIPVLIITSDMDRSEFERIRALGVAGYLIKPFSATDLEKELDKVSV